VSLLLRASSDCFSWEVGERGAEILPATSTFNYTHESLCPFSLASHRQNFSNSSQLLKFLWRWQKCYLPICCALDSVLQLYSFLHPSISSLIFHPLSPTVALYIRNTKQHSRDPGQI